MLKIENTNMDVMTLIYVCFRFLKMLFLLFTACLIAVTHAGCPMRPTVGQTSANRTQGDGGYRILVKNEYIPDTIHIISLQGLIFWKIKRLKLEIKRYIVSWRFLYRTLILNCYRYENIKFQDHERTRDCNNLHASLSQCTLHTCRLLRPTSVISSCFRIPWPPLTRTALTRYPKQPISRNRRYELPLKKKKKLINFTFPSNY